MHTETAGPGEAPHHPIPRAGRLTLLGWGALGAALLGLTALLTAQSHRFGYDHAVRDMPVFWLAGGLMLAGLLYLPLARLIRRTASSSPGTMRSLLFFVVAAGLAMRLVLMSSEPALEDDWQRYLWDGALTAHGLNPYAISPQDAKAADPRTTTVGKLALESGVVLGRVNHPEIRTIYPPVAQGVFAVAHWLQPWSLLAWRGIVLLLDLASLGLILVLLRDLGRSPLWAALYWWNPVALKELFNSAHMDIVVVPLVLLALVLAVRQRFLTATTALTVAAGAKIWPALLLPLVWRPLLGQPGRLAAAVLLAAAAAALFAAPMWLAGVDQSLGVVAYAQKWKTNSALFPQIEMLMGGLLSALSVEALPGGTVARALIGATLAGLALWLNRTPFQSAEDLTSRCLVLCGALFLLSPAQFPWYYLWVLPLLPLRPVTGFLVLTATLPLYYAAFHFLSADTYHIYRDKLVWLVWLPAWTLLALEVLKARRFRLAPSAPAGG